MEKGALDVNTALMYGSMMVLSLIIPAYAFKIERQEALKVRKEKNIIYEMLL